jgi:L-lactate utilization protein LutB
MKGLFSKSDEAAIQKLKEFNTMTPTEKVRELQKQLKEERVRAIHAESELTRLKELHQNAVYHKDGIIENLQSRLDKAEARIEDLEEKYCVNSG